MTNDNARSSKTGAQDGQYTPCRSRGHRHAQRSRKRWRNVLLHGRHRVHPRSHCRAHEHQRNRDVIRPRGTVHVRHVRVRPRDEVAFAWHDQELAGSSGKVCPSEHLQEALSRRKGGGSAGAARRIRGASLPEDRLTCWPETVQAIATRVRVRRTAPQAANFEEMTKVRRVVMAPPIPSIRTTVPGPPSVSITNRPPPKLLHRRQQKLQLR